MIDIVGNIKVDESRAERVKQLIACIRSYAFLKDTGATMSLFLNDCSDELSHRVNDEIQNIGILGGAWKSHAGVSVLGYGHNYAVLLRTTILPGPWSDFVINFMEDQFMVADSERMLANLLGFMRQYKADVCKASFFQVEQNSTRGIQPIADVPGLGLCFDNTAENHVAYCQYYGERYYVGVNFLTTREFALRFWERHLGPRPHPYEIVHYDAAWKHRCIIPGFELQAAIDDDHGQEGSCLLKRTGATKFWNIYNVL